MVEIDYESCYWALKTQMEVQTRQLRQSLKFEALLKQITDKVRDSLDEAQILQHAVEALGKELRLGACNAALYDLERRTSTIIFEYVRHFPSSLGRVAMLDRYAELYHQLLEGDYFQFCSIQPHPDRGRVTMLACPICDDEGVIGDLWLVNPAEYVFSEMEIRLVQQTANQCAIALRQARLYQASQHQVQELERLHQLKDEFLSTVSHELRTPMTNLKMGIRMLELSLESLIHQVSPDAYGRLQQYVSVLRGECERETSLINDLLDLQRLESEKWNLQLEPIDPEDIAQHLASRFQARAEEHGRRFQVNVAGHIPLLESDRRGLERILAELINNACKYTPALETIKLLSI
jgi:signal transduction histidine kinase